MIAREAGMSEEQCEMVYFAALLHDVGKIGVPDAIINKTGRLTDEEFGEIKKHPVYGYQILSSIQQSPYLSIGAHFHHERYDGHGYPDGLMGEDIPEIARVIAVADSYDAMTSRRSYRDVIPQQAVREELVKGMGTQFDSRFAKIMLHLIDKDMEYQMREHMTGSNASSNSRLRCESVYNDCSVGVLIDDRITHIQLFCRSDDGYSEDEAIPALILFDSLDGRVHTDEDRVKDLLYFEYAKIRFDGRVECEGARKTESTEFKAQRQENNSHSELSKAKDGASHFRRFDVEAVRYKDHVRIDISDGAMVRQTVLALPDSVRFAYVSLTGDHCMLMNIRFTHEEEKIGADHIPRIAEEVSYIKDCPTGDIPNVQVDGWKLVTTRGIPLKDDLRIKFHSRSLPTARLIWHCPYIAIFTSEDGKPYGTVQHTNNGKPTDRFREFVLIRLDGENWESDEHAKNKVIINKTEDFEGWTAWKEKNKEGIDCEVFIHRESNTVTVKTENLGISIRSVTTINDDVDDLYVALTGDQVALTDIHICRSKDE